MSDVAEVPLMIVFLDLNSYSAQIAEVEDIEVARVMRGFYRLVGEAVEAAGGRVVKFIGDAALVVFPPELADECVSTVLRLKGKAEEYFAAQGWNCRMIAKVHFGTVAAGDFGTPGDRRYDVLGKAVNVAARLKSNGIALSAEAFQQLGAELRKSFSKNTPPVTYVRLEDSHQPPW